MKIPDHVIDLMLIGAIGAICFIPHGGKPAPSALSARSAVETAGAPAGCVTPVQPPSATPIVGQPAPPARPIRSRGDYCPACGMG